MNLRTTFYNLRAQREHDNAQAEIRAAKALRRSHPSMTWTEALRIAMAIVSRMPK